MQGSLIEQGIELMTYGMGTVFVFLALLVVVTTFMSKLVQRFAKPELSVPASSSTGAAPVSAGENEHLIAVISAAIHKYRSRHK